MSKEVTPQALNAAEVAQRMLKAAKTKDPIILANAAMIVIEVACLAKDPDKWTDMVVARNAVKGETK